MTTLFTHISLGNRLNSQEKMQPYISQYILFRTEETKFKLIPSPGCLGEQGLEGGLSSAWL